VSRLVLEKNSLGKTTVILPKDHVWKFIGESIDFTYLSVNSKGSDDC
jgi:hypothetical protein